MFTLLPASFQVPSLATQGDAGDNGKREELITVTQDPKDKKNDKDYIDDENISEEREDAVVEEQGKESFPASDPPANY